MFHGAGGGRWEWAIWRRVFEAHGWNVSTPDLQPVAGGLAATQVRDYVDQVLYWMQQAGYHGHNGSTPEDPVPKLVLIGASLGGLLVLIASARIAPALLVLINPLAPAAIGSIAIESRLGRQDYPDIVRWGTRRSLASTARAMPDADAAARLFAFRRWRDESGPVLRAAASGIQVEFMACPTLVLIGENDTDVSPSTSVPSAMLVMRNS